MTVSNIRQNILFDVQGIQINAEPGSTYERVITVQNRDNQIANLFLCLKAEGKDQEILQWYTFKLSNSSREETSDTQYDKYDIPLKLEPGELNKIILTFEVPLTAEAGIYNYEVCIRGTGSGEPICRPQHLVIKYSNQHWEARKEPEFLITPLCSSESPQVLEAGETLTFEITVKNRSNIVDSFFVTCPELNQENLNLHIDYPESSPLDGLRLNPETEGIIKLTLHSQKYSPPGQYFSTLRLKSQKTNRVVLGMIYFNIPVNDRLELIDLFPESRHIPSTNSSFKIQICNQGNIQRQINILAKDDEYLLTFQIKPNILLLQAGDRREVTLIPKLSFLQRWRRPWKDKERVIPFHLSISNLKEDSSLSLPESKSATLVWKPHPSWQLWLLMIIPIVLGLVAVAALIYWGVWSLIVQPSLKPKIIEFATTEKSYQAEQGDGIHLNWEIRNIEQLSKLKITVLRNDTEVNIYNYNFKIICDLKNHNHSIPICSFNTDSPDNQPYIYQFNNFNNQQRETIPIKNLVQKAGVANKESCQIESVPVDNYKLHSLWKFIYHFQEMQNYKDYETKALKCRKMIAVPFQTKRAQSQDIGTTSTSRISAQRTNTPKSDLKNQEGNYEFKIELFKEEKSETPSASKIIKDIKVTPAPPEPPLIQPDIQVFDSALPTYRQPDSENAKANEPLSQPQLPTAPIKLNWVITNPKNIARLEMKTVLTGLNGTILSLASEPFSFISLDKSLAQKKEPIALGILSKYCRLQDNERLLICENFPITINNTPGQYKFTLTAIPLPGEKTKDLKLVSKTTEAVQIKPILPQIVNFKLNGQDVLQNPNQILMVEPGKSPTDVFLSWEVKNPKQMTVELLPAPGQLPPSENKIRYKLSPNPGSTPIILKVTNKVGESVTRTVVLETAVKPPVKPGTPLQVTPPPLPPDNAAPSSNSPLNPEELPPFELPPRTN